MWNFSVHTVNHGSEVYNSNFGQTRPKQILFALTNQVLMISVVIYHSYPRGGHGEEVDFFCGEAVTVFEM